MSNLASLRRVNATARLSTEGSLVAVCKDYSENVQSWDLEQLILSHIIMAD